MAKEILDFQIFDGTIASGASETLRVQSRRAETVAYFANDANTLDKPAPYDAEVRIEHIEELGNPLTLLDKIQRSKSTAYETFGYGQFIEVEFTNINSTDEDYRFILKSYREVTG